MVEALSCHNAVDGNHGGGNLRGDPRVAAAQAGQDGGPGGPIAMSPSNSPYSFSYVIACPLR